MLGQLQTILGLGLRDTELLIGALAFLLGVILLGLSGNLRRRSWLFWLGFLVVIAGAGTLILGLAQGTHTEIS